MKRRGDGAVQEDAEEGDEMVADQGIRQALVVAGQAAEAGRPGDVALNDPVTGPIGRFTSGSFRRIAHLLLRCCPAAMGLRTQRTLPILP